jgi:hypothetical protein
MSNAINVYDFFSNAAQPHTNSTVNRIGWGAAALTGLGSGLIWSGICQRVGIPTADENSVIILSTIVWCSASATAALIARHAVLEINDHCIRPVAKKLGYQLDGQNSNSCHNV